MSTKPGRSSSVLKGDVLNEFTKLKPDGMPDAGGETRTASRVFDGCEPDLRYTGY